MEYDETYGIYVNTIYYNNDPDNTKFSSAMAVEDYLYDAIGIIKVGETYTTQNGLVLYSNRLYMAGDSHEANSTSWHSNYSITNNGKTINESSQSYSMREK